MARTWIPLTMACAVLLASVPLASAQEEGSGDPQTIEFDGVHAEGRFVAFDVDAEAGAICDWSFEGEPVIEAIAGVSGNARAEGRVVMAGGGSASLEGACDVEAEVGSGGGAGDAGAGSSTGTPPSANDGGEEMDDQDGLDEEDNDANGTSASATTSGSPPNSTTGTSTTQASARVAAAQVKLHDNPRGAIMVDLDAGQTVRMDLAGDVDAEADGDRVRLEGDGFSASLFLARGSGDVTVEVQDATIVLDAEAAAKVHFRMDDGDLEEDDREAVEEHVDDGDVACEVFVSDDGQPDVVVLDDTNVSVQATTTSVRVDLDISIDVDVEIGGSDGDGTTTQPSAQTTTSTTRTTTTTQPPQTTQPPAGGGDEDDGGGDGGDAGVSGCACAAKVIILDVDVTVFVLEADDDLLVRLDGELLARADSVQDALTIEAGEDPEALVVVDSENEVKVITSLASGSSQLTLEAQGGEEFTTREPVRVTRTTTLQDADADGGIDRSEDGGAAGDDTDRDGNVDVPGFGLGAGLLAVAVVALLAARRRLD